MPKVSTPDINRRELLFIIEYLLKYTDENHTATIDAICEYAAQKYGLKYDKNNGTGNEIRRTRISDCLNYLYNGSVDLPFVLERTDGGKYYIERGFLSEDEIIKICSALKNDKYTTEEDGAALTRVILDLFGNVYNRDRLQYEIDALVRNNDKLNSDVAKAIRLLEKSKKTNCLVCLVERHPVPGEGFKDITVKAMFHSVRQYNGEEYAILVPVVPKDYKNIIFEKVSKLEFAGKKESEILEADLATNRDIDEEFRNHQFSRFFRYDTIDEYIKNALMPKSLIGNWEIEFQFPASRAKDISASFKRYFGADLKYDIVTTVEAENRSKRCYSRITANSGAFYDWVLSEQELSRCIQIISPSFINHRLARHYKFMWKRYEHYEEEFEQQMAERRKRREARIEERKRHEEMMARNPEAYKRKIIEERRKRKEEMAQRKSDDEVNHGVAEIGNRDKRNRDFEYSVSADQTDKSK